MTCNREKRHLAPELWARRLLAWEIRRKYQAALADDPLFGTPLGELLKQT